MMRGEHIRVNAVDKRKSEESCDRCHMMEIFTHYQVVTIARV